MKKRATLLFLLAAAVSGCTRHVVVATSVDARNARLVVYPGATWDSIANPESAGWSRAGLEQVRAELAKTPTTATVVVVNGRVLMTYGDVTAISYLASVRKSLLAALMG